MDVAREAGVSERAASTALNAGQRSSTRVSAQTRERVLAVAQRLGYRPNATARALVSRRTNTVGVVTNFLGEEPNLYFLEMFSGVIQGATTAGQTTAVFTLNDWDQASLRIPALCDGRVDGLILLAPRLQGGGAAWLPPHTPVVSVHADRPTNGIVNIHSDDEVGAYEMVRHLLAAGYRRILHVGGPTEYSGANRRVDGYRRAHADAGVKPPPAHVIHAPLSVDGGRHALQQWLQRQSGRQLPDAVFGCNDAIAFGCIEALRERGLRVPDDVSVVGYDNTWMARSVQMATVRQPLHEMGRRAVEVLVRRVDAQLGGEPYQGPSNIILPTEIVPGTTLTRPRRTSLPIT